MRSRLRRCVVAVLVVLSLVAAACGESDPPDVGGPDPTGTPDPGDGATEPPVALSGTVRLLHSTAQQSAWEWLIEGFNQLHPDVVVEAEYIGGGAQGQTAALLPQLQAGDGPDLFVVYPGAGVPPAVKDMFEGGHTAPMAGRPWSGSHPDWIQDLTYFDGDPHMLMLGVETGSFVYNVDKFEALGLEVPATFGQVLEMCRDIRAQEPDTIPIAYMGAFLALNGPIMMTMTASDVFAQDPDWNQKRIAGETTFAESNWRRSFEKLLELREAGCFSPSVQGDDRDAVIRQLGNDQAVMTMINSSAFGLLEEAVPDIEFSVFPVPGDTEADTRMLIFPSTGVALNSKAENPEAALALLDYLMEVGGEFNAVIGAGTINPVDFDSGNWPEVYAPLLPMRDRIVTYPVYQWGSTGPYLASGEAIVALLTGQTDVDGAVAMMDAAWGQ